MKKVNNDHNWTTQKVGTPFPQHVLKAPGQNNKYVAMWNKQGKLIFGRAWNDSGVIQCKFVLDKVYTGTDIDGNIQLLSYEPDPKRRTFFYDWILFPKTENSTVYEPVRSENCCAVYWKEEQLIGSMDVDKHVAVFVDDENRIKKNENIKDLMVLCKVIPRKSSKEGIQPSGSTLALPLIVNDWEDFVWGGSWPTNKTVMSCPKKDGVGEQFVALWYRHGKPIMGRAWPKNGLIEASFVDADREFSGATIGSLQLLIRLVPTSVGYDYVWMPYEQIIDHRDKDFLPVHLGYVCPALIPVDGKPILGQVNMKTEIATVAVNGKLTKLEGGSVKELLVLCRKEIQETILV